MSLLPTTIELLARARTDLRMGLPVVIGGGDAGSLMAIAVETLTGSRWEDLIALPDRPVLFRVCGGH